jgi:hypothetical protein
MNKAYYFDGADYIDIGDDIKDIDKIPWQVERNDDFSLVVPDLRFKALSRMSTDIRKVGERVAFERDGVKYWYGIITACLEIKGTGLWEITAKPIISTLKDTDITDYLTHDNVTADTVNTGFYNNTTQIVLYKMKVKDCLEYIAENFYTDIITAASFEFDAADLTEFELFYCEEQMIAVYEMMNSAKAFDWLNQTCRAFGIIILFQDETMIFRRYKAGTTAANFNTATNHDYDLEVYNGDIDENIKQKIGVFNSVTVNEEYHSSVLAYFTYVKTLYYTTEGGYLRTTLSNLCGTYDSTGWVEYSYATAAYPHGLGLNYAKMKIGMSQGASVYNLDATVDEDYDFDRYMGFREGKFAVLSSTRVRFNGSLESYPRVEVEATKSADITDGGSHPLADFGLLKHGMNGMSYLTIPSGAYAGTYYSVQTPGGKYYQIVDESSVSLRGVVYSADATVNITLYMNHAVASFKAASGSIQLTFFDGEQNSWIGGTTDATLYNCSYTDSGGNVISYDGTYTHADDTVGSWWVDGTGRILFKPSAVVRPTLNYYYIETVFTPVVKAKPASNTYQVAFPSFFVFFKSLSTSSGDLYELTNPYPIGLLSASSFLYHLLAANTHASDIVEQDINIDDTETMDDACVKAVEINCDDLSIDIKQQRVL